MDSKLLTVLALLSILLLIGSCSPKPSVEPGLQTTQELKKFEGTKELKEFLKEAQGYSVSYLGGFASRAMSIETDMSMAQEATAESKSGGASEVSQTNVQVKGVDEADFVKNDNKYIYVLSNNKLTIIDAYPADDAEVLSETKIEGNPTQMFVNGNRLVVFTQEYENIDRFAEFDFIPRPRSTSVTHAIVFDISDREYPEQVFDYNLLGHYFQSRMIGDYVYFIVQENAVYNPWNFDVPIVREGRKTVVTPEIFYFDNPENNYNYHTIASIDIQSDDKDINAETFLLGYSNNLYVSENNIYITYRKNLPLSYEKQNEARFYDVVVPLLAKRYRDEINKINDDELSPTEKWIEISGILEEMYNSMNKDNMRELQEEIEEAIDEYEARLEAERRKTVIHKISIDDGIMEYEANGEVPGYLLNQFSMDEHDGYFRVATNVQLWRKGRATFNNVYVLDDVLDIVGRLEGLAEDESIYSTRFIGNRLYMVTFKRIDPLFVIDLSDPEDPEVLGELKIPGYSDYLHPYDEDHIIGIGKETDSNQWGGVSVQGVKLALFDVSDVSNPKLIDQYEIGDSGTDSEALRDHKAFLFDKQKNILVIPVRRIDGNRYYDEGRGYWRQDIWQGAYVFGVTPDGFDVKARISHYQGDQDDKYRWYSSPYAVRRSLYMDDVLYTISNSLIMMNSLDDFDELNSVELPNEGYNKPRPVPLMERSEKIII